MGAAQQSGDPAHLVSTTHSTTDALKLALLENRSIKTIASYRIGWVSASADKTSMHEGPWLKIAEGLQPEATTEVPAQQIELDNNAHLMLFFVAEVVYSDGSHWDADAVKLIDEAKSR
jgi:hypothetical protein